MKMRRHTALEAGLEDRFAGRIRHVLDESARKLPAERVHQLELARKMALRAQRSDHPVAQWATGPVIATVGGTASEGSRFARFGISTALVVLAAAGLIGIFQVERQRHIDELAEIDSAMLTDDIPISAYADHGFNAFLKEHK